MSNSYANIIETLNNRKNELMQEIAVINDTLSNLEMLTNGTHAEKVSERKLTAEGRKAISEAAKLRWERYRARKALQSKAA